MIVRPHDGSLLLIRQPDHAALAARIMRGWKAGGLADSSRRELILQAIEQHDNGWTEVDASPMVDASGQILDFVHAPDDVRRGVWPRGVERLAATPYVAALVAQHAIHIYARYKDDPGWMPFFLEMQAARDRHLREAAPLSRDDLLKDYTFVRLGDLASLTFCAGWTDVQTDVSSYAMRLDGDRLIIAPDPFGGATVPIEITGRELPIRSFGSSADARQALSAAPARTLTGIACGEVETS